MEEASIATDVKSLWKWIGGSAFLASMCCFPSVVLVFFGLASVSSAAALSNDLYWGTNGMGWFRPALSAISVVLVVAGLVMYFRGEGICSLDEAKRQRNASSTPPSWCSRLLSPPTLCSISSFSPNSVSRSTCRGRAADSGRDQAPLRVVLQPTPQSGSDSIAERVASKRRSSGVGMTAFAGPMAREQW